jgi:TetR/AcrR family transcriptional regulator
MSTTSKYMPAEARRAATVETVVALAAERNPEQITTAAIAERMGLTQGALFKHFPSKDAILQAVIGWVAERLLARVDQAIAGQAEPLAALEAVFLAHVGFVADHPGVPRMLFGELQRDGDTVAKRMARTLLRGYRERLHGLLEAGVSGGQLDPALDVEIAATLFVGSVQGLIMQSLIAADVERMRADAPRVFAIYRRGIGARP